MNEPRTLGVVGTLVWDEIVGPGGDTVFEGWGGLTYALCALPAALAEGWRVRPVVKVGHDLAEEARALCRALPLVHEPRLLPVAEPNNRVRLSYRDAARRTERLEGGVPGWGVEELARALEGCDAVLVNFISGHEMTLDVAAELRARVDGPLYADLHSLFLGMRDDGVRVPRSLPRWESWARSFDVVQMNADEFRLMAEGGDPWVRASAALRREADPDGPWLIFVTLGGDGCAYLHSAWDEGERPLRGEVTVPSRRTTGDPTGCGDVWGAVAFARLLAGDAVSAAASAANRIAAHGVDHVGTEGLTEHLALARTESWSSEVTP